MQARLAPGVGLYVSSKDPEATAYQAHGSIGMATGTTPIYFVQSTSKTCGKSRVHVPSGQPGHIICDGWEPENAWPALSRALVGQVTDDSG
jgi:hypothetical protein